MIIHYVLKAKEIMDKMINIDEIYIYEIYIMEYYIYCQSDVLLNERGILGWIKCILLQKINC